MNARLDWLKNPKHAALLQESKDKSIRLYQESQLKYADRREKINRNYRQRYPERVSEFAARRRARLRGQAPKLSPDDRGIISTIRETAQRVERCTGIQFDVDHVMPIALGGLHVPGNMRVMPAYWNRKKNAKHPEEFAQMLDALGVTL